MTVRDPVCSRTISIAEVAASVDHEGWAYFFCSTECQLAFKVDPKEFAGEHPIVTPDMKVKTDNA